MGTVIGPPCCSFFVTFFQHESLHFGVVLQDKPTPAWAHHRLEYCSTIILSLGCRVISGLTPGAPSSLSSLTLVFVLLILKLLGYFSHFPSTHWTLLPFLNYVLA